MKKLTYLLLLVLTGANAQIVNIPDTNFKAKLLAADVINHIAYGNGGYMKIDTNNDGQIQQTEVSLIDSLNVNAAGIIDMTGISDFVNLKKLNCKNNQIVSLSLAANASLKQLYCNDNQIVSLDLTSNTLLNDVYCGNNLLTTLNVSGLGVLFHLFCENNQLTVLNTTGLSLLSYLNCSGNQLTGIDVSNMTFLENFWCQYNAIASPMNLGNFTNLYYVDCSNNQIPSINTTGSPLGYLYCQNNQLTGLNLTTNSNLAELNCSNNHLAALDITNSPNLFYLSCSNNLLTTLDLSTQMHLNYLYCEHNLLTNLDVGNLTTLQWFNFGNPGLNPVQVTTLQNLAYLGFYGGLQTTLDVSALVNLTQIGIRDSSIQTLDFSHNTLLYSMGIFSNPNLTYANLKNGRTYANYMFVFFNDCPNLLYVCAEESSIPSLSTISGNSGMNANVQVNSYCSFTPGGNFNTITGSIIFDADNNGCDTADLPQSNIKINLNDGITQGATFTNNLGNYGFNTQAGNFQLSPNVENPSWFNFSPVTTTIPFADSNNNTAIQNFCISRNGNHADLEVVIAPFIPARPGFNAVYKIVYKNKGNQTLSGDVTFGYDDAVLDFVGATVAPDTQSANLLSWNYVNLLPFENRSFYLILHVNSPTDTPPVNIDEVLNFQAIINPVSGDELPVDNTFNYHPTVVGSFDPNNIACLEGETVPTSDIGNYLHYAINFENTGTDVAENIVVRTEIDPAQYDINSLQLLATSHNAYIRQTGNTIEFIFQNLNLDTGGHGNILLKIRSKNNLGTGDTVSKKADIFFDYNVPVVTGLAVTTFQALNAQDFETDNTISVYPNPAQSIINVKAKSNINSVQLYDVQGRLLQTQLTDQPNTSVDISGKTAGVYFLKITSEAGTKVQKIIKE